MAVKENIPEGRFFVGGVHEHTIDVKQADGTTAQPMTDWELTYVWRMGPKSNDPIAIKVANASITIGNGVDTNDRATVPVDLSGTSLGEGSYYGALWRTDAPSDAPLWYGTVALTAVAQQ